MCQGTDMEAEILPFYKEQPMRFPCQYFSKPAKGDTTSGMREETGLRAPLNPINEGELG